MKLDSLLMLGLTALLLGACAGQKGVSPCATDLEYITNINTYGIDTLTQSSAYMASLFVGADDSYISAKLDTGSSELVVNEDDFVAGVNTQLGKNGYSFNHGNKSTVAINAVDSMQIGCSATIDTRFAITSKNLATGNILGLAFGDTERLAHEAFNKPFFDQLVKSNGFKDVFSLSLCASRARSHVLFGGIDTGVSFNLFPTEMAERAAEKVIARAKELGLYNKLPHGFFRTERSANSSVTRFRNLAQIRQFPSFEITFEGADGNIKALELSPLHYFKEMSNFDPLVRSFGIRESKGPIVLGQPFLENHYIVIDRKNALIAFGDINYACSP